MKANILNILAMIIALLLLVVPTSRASDTLTLDQNKLDVILNHVLDTLSFFPKVDDVTDPFETASWEYREYINKITKVNGYHYPPAYAFTCGVEEATQDIRQGVLIIKWSGEDIVRWTVGDRVWNPKIVLDYILLTRYKVRQEWVSTWGLPHWADLYIEGYNRVSKAVMNQYFGCDVEYEASHAIRSTLDEWIKNEKK